MLIYYINKTHSLNTVYECTVFPECGTLVPKYVGNSSLVFVLIKTVQLVGVIKWCTLIAGYIISQYSRFINSNNYNIKEGQVLYCSVEGKGQKIVQFAFVLLLLLKEMGTLLMKRQFVIAHLYTVLQEAERT